MEGGNLPTEIAQEPIEEAHLSQPLQGAEINSLSMPPANKQRKGITFAEATESIENSQASSTATYKDVLSQPAAGLSHKQRLLWLQKRRSAGLWVQCDDCDRWRFLADVLDAHQLSAKWRCKMNPDKSAADCSVPEAALRLREEEDLIHSEYSAGSVVWARLAGWPWWPAMVDDCPDTEQYYWLDGFSDIPTHYNVVFFDALDVTRAWISPEKLRPYAANKKTIKISNDKRYRKRLETAVIQADDAEKLNLSKRLAKYSFITRYSGSINNPKHVNKHEVKKFQMKLKRMYDIDFPNESEEDDDVPLSRGQTTVIKKKNNLLLVGTPKSKSKEKKRRTSTSKNIPIKKILLEEAVSQKENNSETNEKDTIITANDTLNSDALIFKQPDSLLAQVGSNVASTVADITFDRDTSVTYVPDSESESEILRETAANINKRAISPNSDDFDF